MKSNDAFYKEVVNVTYDYLGPAADRFVEHQVRSHLSKKPEQLCKQDIASLVDWFGLAMSMLSEDMKLVNKYVSDLKHLASTK